MHALPTQDHSFVLDPRIRHRNRARYALFRVVRSRQRKVSLPARIQLPQYGKAEVIVDPWLNGGQPTVARRGVRVADIVSRLRAHESPEDVAGDYGLTVPEVEAIRQGA
jgi:uncharacterized protein (DUF433 family)